MNTIFHIAAALALFFAVLVFSKRPKSLPDIILSLWLVLSAGNIFGQHLISDHELVAPFLMALN